MASVRLTEYELTFIFGAVQTAIFLLLFLQEAKRCNRGLGLIGISGRGHSWVASRAGRRRSAQATWRLSCHCPAEPINVGPFHAEKLAPTRATRQTNIHERERPVAATYITDALYLYLRHGPSFDALHLGTPDLEHGIDCDQFQPGGLIQGDLENPGDVSYGVCRNMFAALCRLTHECEQRRFQGPVCNECRERGFPPEGTSNAYGALGVHRADFRLTTLRKPRDPMAQIPECRRSRP
jgi:hypothetical protein